MCPQLTMGTVPTVIIFAGSTSLLYSLYSKSVLTKRGQSRFILRVKILPYWFQRQDNSLKLPQSSTKVLIFLKENKVQLLQCGIFWPFELSLTKINQKNLKNLKFEQRRWGFQVSTQSIQDKKSKSLIWHHCFDYS